MDLTGLLIGLIIFGAIMGMLFIIIYFKTNVVVPFNEIHVISRGKNVYEYDGKGRYRYFSFFHGRTIIPKHVLDIEPGLLDLHDCDNLPFGVEISIKVQVTDPQKAAATLTRLDHSTVSKVVEDTVMSAARSIAMERTILDIMKNREEIEKSVYEMVADALNKLGLSAIIFDIKNIRDIEGRDVIGSLERAKIAELEKEARISEAIHDNEAKEVEVERKKATQVKIEKMQQEEEQARVNREREVAKIQMELEKEKLKIEEQKLTRFAEIEQKKARIIAEANRERKMIEAQAEANSIEKRAMAESNAIKLQAEADSEAIRMKGMAEVEVLKEKSEVLKRGSAAAQLQILQILGKAQVDTAGKIAEALGKNNKIMYIPMENNGNFLGKWLPKIEGLLESGMLSKLVKQLNNGGEIATITTKEPKKLTKK
ncbi:MAG: SPFH domain-containing protein [Promethearchaeota archaeon]